MFSPCISSVCLLLVREKIQDAEDQTSFSGEWFVNGDCGCTDTGWVLHKPRDAPCCACAVKGSSLEINLTGKTGLVFQGLGTAFHFMVT